MESERDSVIKESFGRGEEREIWEECVSDEGVTKEEVRG
jgi:hypothetical protein